MPRTRRPQPVHFYPRPPRGGRRVFLDEDQSDILISIHALREEGDVGHGIVVHRSGISIHALREEGDLSIRPLPRMTANFYPRPPRGGRQRL